MKYFEIEVERKKYFVPTKSLCKLHPTPRPSASKLRCIQFLLAGGAVGQVAKHCDFVCQEHYGPPIVLSVFPDEFTIIHISKYLFINCPRHKLNISNIDVSGALRASVGCACEIYHAGKLLVPTRIPCIPRHAAPTVAREIPAAWAAYDDLFLPPYLL